MANLTFDRAILQSAVPLLRLSTVGQISFGTVLKSRRSVVFTTLVEQSPDKADFNKIPSPVRAALSSQGKAGAISGVIAYASHPQVQRVFWQDWGPLGCSERRHLAPIPWSDMRFVGSIHGEIDFRLILEDHPAVLEQLTLERPEYLRDGARMARGYAE